MQIRTWTLTTAAAILLAIPALAQGTGAEPVKPMAADAHSSFAVATIKPHDPNYPRRQGWNFIGDRVRIATKPSPA